MADKLQYNPKSKMGILQQQWFNGSGVGRWDPGLTITTWNIITVQYNWINHYHNATSTTVARVKQPPFVTPALVSPKWRLRNKQEEIPYWWHVNTQIWVVLLIGGAALYCFSQSEALPRSEWWSDISTEFTHPFLRHIFMGKPLVASQNVGCFLCCGNITGSIFITLLFLLFCAEIILTSWATEIAQTKKKTTLNPMKYPVFVSLHDPPLYWTWRNNKRNTFIHFGCCCQSPL